eukprot:645269-Prymnesium_polylepis.1
MRCLLSVSDAKRLMRFVPATTDMTSYTLNEFEKRHALFTKGVPSSTARETQARCDAVMGTVMNQAVLRTVESGKKMVSTVVWEIDSLNRLKADGIYLYAAHADPEILSTPTNSVGVSDKWKLLSPQLSGARSTGSSTSSRRAARRWTRSCGR